MATALPPLRGRPLRRRIVLGAQLSLASMALGLGPVGNPSGRGDEPATPPTHFYSTAAPPVDHAGPVPSPTELAVGPSSPDPSDVDLESIPDLVPEPGEPRDLDLPPEKAAVTRVAAAPRDIVEEPAPRPATPAPPPAAADPVTTARRMIADCKTRYRQVTDYTCTFYKKERVGSGMTSQHVMAMKCRTKPMSVYFKFIQPNAGREAIYVAGRHGGKALVHDIGLGKLLAGTLALDPKSNRAMENCRHPITEAGIGHMIDTIAQRWGAEMRAGETQVQFKAGVRVGDRICTMIESAHPKKQPNFLFHMVRVYIDHDSGLPIRFEAYDWPSRAGGAPVLVEEYSYANLRLNVGLREADFGPSNRSYAFGRF